MLFPQYTNLVQDLTVTGRRTGIGALLIVMLEYLLFILFYIKHLLYTMFKFPSTSFEICFSMSLSLSIPLRNEMSTCL